MSYTEIIKFNKNGDSSSAGRIWNASRGSWMVWDMLSKKYLGHGFNCFDLRLAQETWDLFTDVRLTNTEKIVLGSTYDFVLIKKEDIRKVIDAYREFSILNENLSLNEQAEILQALEKDTDCIAIGFHQNSVSCDMWNNYNCVNGTEHWYLFDDINNIEREKAKEQILEEAAEIEADYE